MGTQMIGTAQIVHGSTTVSLGTRLHNQTFRESRSRHIEESEDLTQRAVVVVGSAKPELVGTIRLHDDPEELRAMISDCLDGTQLDYSPDNGVTTYETLLIDASDITPDKDFPAGLPTNSTPLYQVTLTLRATGSTANFDGLKALP